MAEGGPKDELRTSEQRVKCMKQLIQKPAEPEMDFLVEEAMKLGVTKVKLL